MLDLIERFARGVVLLVSVALSEGLGVGRDDATAASLRGGLGIMGLAGWGVAAIEEAAVMGEVKCATAITPVKFDRRRGPPLGLAPSGREGTEDGRDSTNRRGSYLYPVGTSPRV